MTANPGKLGRKKAIWAIALMLGLPLIYVGSYLSFNFMIGVGITTEAQCDPFHDIVYAPLLAYRHSSMPGSMWFREICQVCFDFGFERKAMMARHGWPVTTIPIHGPSKNPSIFSPF